MSEVNSVKLCKFVREQRDELMLLKELVNSGGSRGSQYTEAYRRIDSMLSLFADMYECLVEGELPEALVQEEQREAKPVKK